MDGFPYLRARVLVRVQSPEELAAGQPVEDEQGRPVGVEFASLADLLAHLSGLSEEAREASALMTELLTALGWSQAKFARKLGVDPNTVTRWIRGHTPVPKWALEYLQALNALKQVAKKLDIL